MTEMYSWYIDNNKYLKKTFVDEIISYSIESKETSTGITDILEHHQPTVKNKSSNITAARDFGIIDSNSLLSDASILYNDNFYDYCDYVLDLMSKRNVLKSKAIPLKPLVIIAKVFDKMFNLEIYEKDIFLTTAECYKYLSVIESYKEITDDMVKKIVENRVYENGANVPKKAVSNVKNEVCYSLIFSALSDSNIFELGALKSIIRPVKQYRECINYISTEGEHISMAPIATKGNGDALYSYMCDISTGIKEIIPQLKLKSIPPKVFTRYLFEHLFGINESICLEKYFDEPCYGKYRKLYPIKGIVIAKIYTDYNELAEWLADYILLNDSYIETVIGDKLMIQRPFQTGHSKLDELFGVPLKYNTGYSSIYSSNRILFGAPGTGKSFTINNEKDSLMKAGGEYERVTFHPDYSYANFVGTYKPVPAVDSNENDVITYEYVPGPFMRTLVKALDNGRTESVKPYLLIIEEINRANVAAVFGDVFQLLDRVDNVSEYPIQASEDIKKYMAKELGGEPADYATIQIPDNMFIWATMNSADQGVYPMDTAFKRRWDFTYLSINTNEEIIAGQNVTLGTGSDLRVVEWNKLRKAINEELVTYKINEDKLLGTFFIPKDRVPGGDNFTEKEFERIFKNKVIMYLFEDAARQKAPTLFSGCKKKLYSEICEAFDTMGVNIFCDNIRNKFAANEE